jgi:hypothetical protein
LKNYGNAGTIIRLMERANMKRTSLIVLLFTTPLLAQGDKQFSIPLASLNEWSEKVLVSVSAKITGNSDVHKLESDCEMHFGAKVEGYEGDPTGFVLEPMNICVENFFGAATYSKTQWVNFAKSLRNHTVLAEGVPRIWPEHLVGEESASNPNHALELHPVARFTVAGKENNFVPFIYAPEGFEGGVSPTTAQAILTDTAVGVKEHDGTVDIDFDSGRIGNFTTLDIRIRRQTTDGTKAIQEQAGGHRLAGEVVLSRSRAIPVSLLTVKGSPMDDQVVKFIAGKQATARFEALVLFSLSPKALLDAAKKSNGERVEVERPIQLILYGTAAE